MNYKISHPTKTINCTVDLPSSKSISNRLLIIQALCKEKFDIKNLSKSNDTIVLIKGLNKEKGTIHINEAGSSLRFLTAYLSAKKGKEYILTGSQRIKERPIKELVDVLRSLGAEIKYVEKEGFAPLRIKGKELNSKEIDINASISSQFISALLLIAPTLKEGLVINLKNHIVSIPYIKMTLKLMKVFGIQSEWTKNTIKIHPQKYIPKKITVEADWSSASFWFEIACLSQHCKIKLNGLSEDSLQGDMEVLNLFSQIGVKSTFKKNSLILEKSNKIYLKKEIDLIKTPDLYQPLKCSLFALKKHAKIKGLDTLKDKESNRIISVENELERVVERKSIRTYNDHRIAMSFAPLSLIFGELEIENIEVVNKSYPNFWKDLEIAGFTISLSAD